VHQVGNQYVVLFLDCLTLTLQNVCTYLPIDTA